MPMQTLSGYAQISKMQKAILCVVVLAMLCTGMCAMLCMWWGAGIRLARAG